MNLQEYRKAKRQLQEKSKAELAEDMRLLDRLYEKLKEETNDASSNGHVQHETKQPAGKRGTKTTVGKGMVITGVREIFATHPAKEFTAEELTGQLISEGINTTKASVNGAIGKLIKDKYLEATVKGTGRRPGKFRKKS
jgi:hypothetical protein